MGTVSTSPQPRSGPFTAPSPVRPYHQGLEACQRRGPEPMSEVPEFSPLDPSKGAPSKLPGDPVRSLDSGPLFFSSSSTDVENKGKRKRIKLPFGL